MKKRFSEEQIIGFLREAEAGMPIIRPARRGASGSAETTVCVAGKAFGVDLPVPSVSTRPSRAAAKVVMGTSQLPPNFLSPGTMIPLET